MKWMQNAESTNSVGLDMLQGSQTTGGPMQFLSGIQEARKKPIQDSLCDLGQDGKE